MPPVAAPEILAGDLKRASVLRRVPAIGLMRCARGPGLEGQVCAFEMAPEASSIVIEAVGGRAMTLASGDVFLATPGYRESTRWVVGGIPDGGLVPGGDYWILSESGVVGDLVGESPLTKSHVGRVKYRGLIVDEQDRPLTLLRFAASPGADPFDRGAPVFLVVGTSAEVGKTTAGISVLRALRKKGHATVIALKATGTSSFAELASYLDFGAAQAFDCVDFGMPTTYPSHRDGVDLVFERALDTCLSIAADAAVVECGGDMLGANVPVFLDRLKRRRPRAKVILAAADALGALGGKRVLEDMGWSLSLIAGPCTDTPTLRQRTEDMCGVAAINLSERGSDDAPV